jgi:hypothetical protein
MPENMDAAGDNNVLEVAYADGTRIEYKSGDQVVVPATAGAYTLKAINGNNVRVFAQYIPSVVGADGKAASVSRDMEWALEAGETRQVLTDKIPAFQTTGVFESVGPYSEMTERVQVNTEASLSPVIEMVARPFTVQAVTGVLKITVPGRTGADSTFVLNEGEGVYFDKEKGIVKGPGYEFTDRQITPESLKIENVTKGGSATIEVSYEKTNEEKLVYTVFAKMMRNIETLAKTPVDIIFPKQMFVEGTGVGSAVYEEKMMNRFIEYYYTQNNRKGEYEALVSKHGGALIKIVTYNGELEDAVRRNIRPEAQVVLGASTENIKKEGEKAKVDRFLSNPGVKVLPLPDVGLMNDKGLGLVRELEGTALIQASLTKDSIQKQESIATDFQSIMQQLVQRPLENYEMYFFLSYSDVQGLDFKELGVAISREMLEEILKNRADTISWLKYFLGKIKPIRPQDLREQLEQRRKVMWSV